MTDLDRHGYFGVFDLEPRFLLSIQGLEQSYRALAGRLHPDRFAASEESARERSLELSTLVNEAHRTLRSPRLRAQHLLEIRGVATTGDDAPSLPTAALFEHMELREQFAEARDANDPQRLEGLSILLHERSTKLEQRLARQLDELQDDTGAARTIQELMFSERLASEIADAQCDLEEACPC